MMFDDSWGTVLFISPWLFVLWVLIGPSRLGEEILVGTHAWVFVGAWRGQSPDCHLVSGAHLICFWYCNDIAYLLQVALSTDQKMISFTVEYLSFFLYIFLLISLSLLKASLLTFMIFINPVIMCKLKVLVKAAMDELGLSIKSLITDSCRIVN